MNDNDSEAVPVKGERSRDTISSRESPCVYVIRNSSGVALFYFIGFYFGDLWRRNNDFLTVQANSISFESEVG